MRQRIAAIARIMGHEFEFIDLPYDLAVSCHVLWRRQRSCRFRDTGKIQRELGWKPAETFETGIRKTIAWYLANPEWVAHVQSGAYRQWVDKQYAGTA